jgi:hypothetical protein
MCLHRNFVLSQKTFAGTTAGFRNNHAYGIQLSLAHCDARQVQHMLGLFIDSKANFRNAIIYLMP